MSRYTPIPHAEVARFEDLERLDVLVHNAGYFPLTPLERIDAAVLERTLAVNLAALFWLTQGALPLFAAAGGGPRGANRKGRS